MNPNKSPKKQIVIGIGGKAGAGKDTICDHLVNQYGFTKIALADPIKRLVQDIFVLTDEQTHDRVLREKPLKAWPGWTVRKLLQYIGTEMFRKLIDEDIWVKSLSMRIKASDKILWVVPDVRFPNEYGRMKKAFKKNYISARVERKGKDGSTAGGIAGHESEAYTIDADVICENNGTIQELHKKVDAFVKKIGVKKVRSKSRLVRLKDANTLAKPRC